MDDEGLVVGARVLLLLALRLFLDLSFLSQVDLGARLVERRTSPAPAVPDKASRTREGTSKTSERGTAKETKGATETQRKQQRADQETQQRVRLCGGDCRS